MAVSIASFTIKDSTGTPKTLPVYFPSGMTLANIQAGITALAPLIDAAVDGVIDAVNVTVGATLPGGLKTTPANITDSQRGALLAFSANGTPYRFSMFVPTWAETGFTGDSVDLADGAVAALVSAIEDGVGTGGNELKPSDKYANDLLAILDGKKAFRK